MIGERIRELRKRKNLTLRELAAELEIPFTTLGNYERGDRQPDFDFVLNVAKYFGVSMDYLTRAENLIDYVEYQTNSYSKDVERMINQAEPNLREKMLDIHDKLFFLMVEHTVFNPNNKELDLLQQILSSISKMKNGFGLAINKDGVSPTTKYEWAKLYLKEKQDIDKYFNELLEVYIERSIK